MNDRNDDDFCSECDFQMVGGKCESAVCWCSECGRSKDSLDHRELRDRRLMRDGQCLRCLLRSERHREFYDEAALKVGRSL
jgi:hypothetical protein